MSRRRADGLTQDDARAARGLDALDGPSAAAAGSVDAAEAVAHQGLEKLADPGFKPPSGDPVRVEQELQRVYDQLMKCGTRPAPFPGAVEAAGIKKTEILWVPYREAWLSLVTAARQGENREAWKAWLAEKRTKMLKELPFDCPSASP
jgi:hypothetical protein